MHYNIFIPTVLLLFVCNLMIYTSYISNLCSIVYFRALYNIVIDVISFDEEFNSAPFRILIYIIYILQCSEHVFVLCPMILKRDIRERQYYKCDKEKSVSLVAVPLNNKKKNNRFIIICHGGSVRLGGSCLICGIRCSAFAMHLYNIAQ